MPSYLWLIFYVKALEIKSFYKKCVTLHIARRCGVRKALLAFANAHI
jgi:hypothetical protein